MQYKLFLKRDFVSKTGKNYTIVYFIDENNRLIDRLFSAEKWSSYGIADDVFPSTSSFPVVSVEATMKGYITNIKRISTL